LPRLFPFQYGISLFSACFLALFYAFQSFYPDLMCGFSNVFPPLIAGAAFAFSILALVKYWGSFRERFSLSWLCFAVGLGLWFLGEVSWSVYTLLLSVELPYPSIADVFWLSGYIPIFIALFLYVKTFCRCFQVGLYTLLRWLSSFWLFWFSPFWQHLFSGLKKIWA